MLCHNHKPYMYQHKKINRQKLPALWKQSNHTVPQSLSVTCQYQCMYPFIPTRKALFMSDCKIYHYTYCVCQRCWRLEWIWNFIIMAMWKSCICFIGFYEKDPFYNIYILVIFDHVWMEAIFPINGLGWSILETSNMTIILCETLMYQYN